MVGRRIVKLIRGSATPAQIMLACVLASALGFLPGVAQAPGLTILLTLILIVLNANLALAGILAAGAKLLSLLLMPVSFALGRFLLDGPTQGALKSAINAPVLALFGLEYYATTGGLVLGAGLGLIAGVVIAQALRGFRAEMASLEEESERYRRWMAKGWVKLLVFILLGRGRKKDYSTALQARGKVIRPVGVVFCVFVVALLWTGQAFFSGPIITAALRSGLERANGATVDLASAATDLKRGRMTLTGLAMADPNALDRDLFRAATIEADVSTVSLLQRRLKIDRVVISDASTGERRGTLGRRLGKWRLPRPTIDLRQGEKTLKEYLRNPEVWNDRLRQLQRWIEQLSGPVREWMQTDDEPTGGTFAQRLEREVAARGYRRVAAGHLIEGAPTLFVADLVVEKVRTGAPALKSETLDIRARHLSTHPRLSEAQPAVTITSSGNTLHLGLELGAVSASLGENRVDFAFRGLPVEHIAGDLARGDKPPIAGGTMDVSLRGRIDTTGGVSIDLPMQVTLRNTTMTVGRESAPVEEFTIPLGLRGPIDNLRIKIDDAKLTAALVAAGAGVLAAEARKESDKLIDKALKDADLAKKVPGLDLDRVLGDLAGKKDTAQGKATKAGDDKKSDPIGDAAKSLTEGLFGKKKEKAESRDE